MYKKYFKRIFDILLSLLSIVILFPLIIIIYILILIDSGNPVIFKQVRVTLGKRNFEIYKFRTMKKEAEKQGILTTKNDVRITKIGGILRKTKLDELPQLFNILLGDMSFVGPRPDSIKEVRKYRKDWDDIFEVRAGLTDYASLKFFDLSEQLDKKQPYKDYIERILPEKIELRRKYIENMGFVEDIKIIFKTFIKFLKFI